MKPTMRRVILCAIVAVILAAAWLRPLETTAIDQVDAGFKRALVSFATARALNAGISFAQSLTVAGTPFGLGITVTPGQLLRPVNEVVSQFAELMLIASVVFGAMKILIGIGSYWMVSLFLSVITVGWAWFQWKERSAPVLLTKVLLVLLLIRFAVPLVAVGSDALFQQFMATDYAASQRAIDVTSNQMAALDPTKGDITGWRNTIEQFKAWPGQIKTFVSQLTEQIIKVTVIFVLQTIVIPLFLFWGLCRSGAAILELPRLKH